MDNPNDLRKLKNPVIEKLRETKIDAQSMSNEYRMK